jgi:hypothetical protein
VRRTLRGVARPKGIVRRRKDAITIDPLRAMLLEIHGFGLKAMRPRASAGFAAAFASERTRGPRFLARHVLQRGAYDSAVATRPGESLALPIKGGCCTKNPRFAEFNPVRRNVSSRNPRFKRLGPTRTSHSPFSVR